MWWAWAGSAAMASMTPRSTGCPEPRGVIRALNWD